MIHIHRAAQPAYDHEPFDDGDELELGRADAARPRQVEQRRAAGALLVDVRIIEGGVPKWGELGQPIER